MYRVVLYRVSAVDDSVRRFRLRPQKSPDIALSCTISLALIGCHLAAAVIVFFPLNQV